MNTQSDTSFLKTLACWVALAAVLGLTSLSPRSVFGETLHGRVSGLAAPDSRVDLQLRFFGPRKLDAILAERRFYNVRLDGGRFIVSLDAASLPPGAEGIELGLRPAERRYAMFRVIPPRRRLIRLDAQRLVAVELGAPEIQPIEFKDDFKDRRAATCEPDRSRTNCGIRRLPNLLTESSLEARSIPLIDKGAVR